MQMTTASLCFPLRSSRRFCPRLLQPLNIPLLHYVAPSEDKSRRCCCRRLARHLKPRRQRLAFLSLRSLRELIGRDSRRIRVSVFLWGLFSLDGIIRVLNSCFSGPGWAREHSEGTRLPHSYLGFFNCCSWKPEVKLINSNPSGGDSRWIRVFCLSSSFCHIIINVKPPSHSLPRSL